MMKNGEQHETNLSLTVILIHIVRWREEILIPPMYLAFILIIVKAIFYLAKIMPKYLDSTSFSLVVTNHMVTPRNFKTVKVHRELHCFCWFCSFVCG